MYVSMFRSIVGKFVYFVLVSCVCFSQSKIKILKNGDIKSDSAICYENICELHFIYNVFVKSDNLNIRTDRLIIKFTNEFHNIRELNFLGYIDLTFNSKYRLLVNKGKATFFKNIFTIIGDKSYFFIKSLLKTSGMILQFNCCNAIFNQNNSVVEKYILKNNVKCFFDGVLFIAENGEFDVQRGVILLSNNVYILDKNDNHIISEKVEIDINKNTYNVFNVKDGYKQL